MSNRPVIAKVIRLLGISALLVILACPVGCGSDDDPTGPGGNGGGAVSVSTNELDFGIVWTAVASRTLRFTITADPGNNGPVSGEITVRDDPDGRLLVTGGVYDLAPGESQDVSVLYSPTSAGTSLVAVLEVGAGGAEIPTRGFASNPPIYEFTPDSLDEGTVSTNYQGFTGSGVTVDPVSGVSYGERPDWYSCRELLSWVYNGNPTFESKTAFTLPVPSGVTSVTVELYMEAGNDCVQLLVEIDGDEDAREGFSGSCSTHRATYDITPGTRTIAIGTDQQGAFCYADLAVEKVRFVFKGTLVSKSNWNYRK